jgi:hypothetical protein
VADADGVPIGNGDVVDPVTGAGTQDILAISGVSPLDVALQGVQTFDVNSNLGAAFDSDEAITQDILGTNTQAVLVTHDLTGTVGPAAGDTPEIGSIFNSID